MNLYQKISCLILILLSGQALGGYKIVDTKMSTNGGHIKIDCQQQTQIYLNSKPIGKTTTEQGVFLQNISPGVHIIKTEQQGFAAESWPVSVEAGKIASIIASKSSPVYQNQEANKRLSNSKLYTESKSSLVERNNFIHQLRKENSFTFSGSVSGQRITWSYDMNNPSKKPQNIRKVRNVDWMTIYEKEVQDPDGRFHKIELKRKMKGFVASTYKSAGMFNTSKSGYLWSDMDVHYELYFNGVSVYKKRLHYLGAQEDASYFRGQMQRQTEVKTEETLKLAPVNISISRMKKPFWRDAYGGYVKLHRLVNQWSTIEFRVTPSF